MYYLCVAKGKGEYQSGQMGQTVNLLAYAFGGSNPSSPTISSLNYAEVAQLIEHQPSKLRVAGVSPVFRSRLVLIESYQHFSYFSNLTISFRTNLQEFLVSSFFVQLTVRKNILVAHKYNFL